MIAAAAVFAASMAALQTGTNAHVRVRGGSCDIDRKAGVVMLEGDVRVDHSDGYKLAADSVYLFLTADNELRRVVASGDVKLSDATREATCPLAIYRRQQREVEMFGDDNGGVARLVERGEGRRELEGRRIRFWLDNEQAEVEKPRITVGETGRVQKR